MKRTPHKDYDPGHFTALIRKNDWPPSFEHRMVFSEAEMVRKLAAEKARQIAAATGAGWGCGTITMPNTPKWRAPANMERVA